MKLKELLEVIPDDCEIGLADFNKEICTVTYGTKEDAIMGFAQKSIFIKEQIENMDVISIHPYSHVYCTVQHLFANDKPAPLYVKMQLIIEIG